MSKDEIWQEMLRLYNKSTDTETRLREISEEIDTLAHVGDWNMVKFWEERRESTNALYDSQIALLNSYVDLYVGLYDE